MTRREEKVIQDAAAGRYEQLRYALPISRRYHRWWVERMIGLADSSLLGGSILDNGCGIGLLLEELETRSTVGLDLSLGMLERARGTMRPTVQGDSTRLPFPDESFDLIFARALLHHLPDPDAGLAEMRRVLRPGGQAVLADTNRSLLSDLPRRLAYRSEAFSEHHQNFHRSDYFAAVERYLSIEDVEFFGYLAYPFGFPDLAGPLARLRIPAGWLELLLHLDQALARVPGLRTQSWGVMVLGRKNP